MPVEQRGRVIAVELGPTGSNREDPERSVEGGSLRTMTRAVWIERFTYGSVRGSGSNSPGLLGTRDRVEPAAIPAMSAMAPKAELNSEDWRHRHGPLRVDLAAGRLQKQKR
jgi:hypothetical protein